MSRKPRLPSRSEKLTPEQRKEVYEAFCDYIVYTDDPNVAGFVSSDDVALKHWVTQDNMYDWPEMNELTKRAIAKSEAYLLQKGMGGQGTAMAIFRLKQPRFGYRDKFEQDLTSNGEKITFANAVPRHTVEKPEKKSKT